MGRSAQKSHGEGHGLGTAVSAWTGRGVTRRDPAELRVARHEREVDRRLKVVELELQVSKSWADVSCNFMAKVPDNYCPASEKAQKASQ